MVKAVIVNDVQKFDNGDYFLNNLNELCQVKYFNLIDAFVIIDPFASQSDCVKTLHSNAKTADEAVREYISINGAVKKVKIISVNVEVI